MSPWGRGGGVESKQQVEGAKQPGEAMRVGTEMLAVMWRPPMTWGTSDREEGNESVQEQ